MFIVGEKYSRAKDIHDQYGGTRQSGISPSRSHPFIFLFTGDSGEAYGFQARRVIKDWIAFYNTERPHSALDRLTPDDAYWAGLEEQQAA